MCCTGAPGQATTIALSRALLLILSSPFCLDQINSTRWPCTYSSAGSDSWLAFRLPKYRSELRLGSRVVLGLGIGPPDHGLLSMCTISRNTSATRRAMKDTMLHTAGVLRLPSLASQLAPTIGSGHSIYIAKVLLGNQASIRHKLTP